MYVFNSKQDELQSKENKGEFGAYHLKDSKQSHLVVTLMCMICHLVATVYAYNMGKEFLFYQSCKTRNRTGILLGNYKHGGYIV